MRTANHICGAIALVVLLGMSANLPMSAQEGKLKVKVHPPEAYVFVDGKAMGQAYHTVMLSPGNHRIDLVNYGYKTTTRDVSISSGETLRIEAQLEPIPETVTGPWGCITIENAQRDAVLLNGKSVEFFVGHGDEFNHQFGLKQELVVPPGTYQLNVVREGKDIWTGSVEVPANQRVVVDVPTGVRKTVPWTRGEQMSASPRFHAGIASARVAVAKPTAQLSSQTEQTSCGDSAKLKWNTTDAASVELNPIGIVTANGEQSVQPKQTTPYELKATGPGGTATAKTTVNVNSGIAAKLELSPAEVRYTKVGDKVTESADSSLTWSVSNANAVSIDSLGSVDPTGNRPVQVAPRKTDPGPVDETVTYTLTAANACGGAETRTATLHITGSIKQPEITLAMRSIYFSTDKPNVRGSKGLAVSQQQTLKMLAGAFNNYLADHPDARLVLAGHADRRGPNQYNQALSERRATVVKNFLVKQGVAAEKIDSHAFGEERNLKSVEVKQLITQNLDATDQDRQKALQRLTTMVYAHNRRVDMKLSTTGQESVRNYPFTAEDFSILVKRGELKEGIAGSEEKENLGD